MALYIVLGLLCFVLGIFVGRRSLEPLLQKDLKIMTHMSTSLQETQQAANDWKNLAFKWRRKNDVLPEEVQEDEGPFLH